MKGSRTVAVLSQTADQLLARARELTEPAYRAAVDELPGELRRIAGYHAGWWEADGRSRTPAGKAVRPALVLACATAAGGAIGDAAMAAAVTVELVHDFSLLHDDVMDGDAMRRHQPAAWTVFGTSQAILTGDALLTLAFRQLGGGEAAMVLAAASLELCRGQSADLASCSGSDTGAGLTECLAMAEHKTGALLGAACQLGALAGGADHRVAGCYRSFGRHLGLAFQLTDDLLGIWGDPRVTGKPAGSDLASRKRSLPVVAALTSRTHAGDELASLYGKRRNLDEQAIRHAARLIETAGGRAWTSSEADRQMRLAFAALTQAGPAPDALIDLRLLAELVTRRDH
jgi:geranylgeranyl diphosphate synthase, type I